MRSFTQLCMFHSLGVCIAQDVMFGSEAAKVRQALEISYPVENGIIRNWEDMELLWDYTFNSMWYMTSHAPT